MKRKEIGITLVALVVTIVVLLILAGITLVYVFGDNGIIKLAQDAKRETEAGMQKEQGDMENLVNMLKQYENEGSIPKIGPDKKGEIQTADKTVYKDETGTAIIPGGFCVVKDSPTNTADKNTVASGLVISDKANDDLDNTNGETKGNQFVWIPVTNYNKFHLIEGYFNGSLDTVLSVEKNSVETVAREAGDAETAGSPGLPNTANSTAGSTESIAMYKSVKDNGGFYIARFEAGIAGTTASTDTDDTNKQTQNGTVKPVSQKGVGVWNYIPWGGTSSEKAFDNLPGNDSSNGAVKVARNMYPSSDTTHKVTSTLCYDVQWDAALKFIEPKYGEYNEEKTDYQVAADSYVKTVIKDEVTRGNYSGGIAATGSNTAYQQKHIYDMVGNVYEWTMGAYRTGFRMVRGGSYNIEVSKWPVSVRFYCAPDVSSVSIGARVALYL